MLNRSRRRVALSFYDATEGLNESQIRKIIQVMGSIVALARSAYYSPLREHVGSVGRATDGIKNVGLGM